MRATRSRRAGSPLGRQGGPNHTEKETPVSANTRLSLKTGQSRWSRCANDESGRASVLCSRHPVRTRGGFPCDTCRAAARPRYFKAGLHARPSLAPSTTADAHTANTRAVNACGCSLGCSSFRVCHENLGSLDQRATSAAAVPVAAAATGCARAIRSWAARASVSAARSALSWS